MEQLFCILRDRIPANKFSSPRLDTAATLLRENLLGEIFAGRGRKRPLVMVDAPAGQGKTMLAAQVVERSGTPSAWYQLGEEDGDPVLLLTALLVCLKQAQPGLNASLLQELIVRGEISSFELPRAVDLLLEAWHGCPSRVGWVVLDDLHLLEGAPESLEILGRLTAGAPAGVRFLLTSRQPVELGGAQKLIEAKTYPLGGANLALTLSETTALFHETFALPVPSERIRSLHRTTEGWIMGLLLAVHGRPSGPETPLRTDSDLLDYFRSEVFIHLPAQVRHSLLRLAGLETIPVALAERLTGDAGIGQQLAELARKNFFTRQVDGEGAQFRFHHLFRDILRRLAREQLENEECRALLRKAAIWCLEQGLAEDALHYYLQAGDYPALDRLMEREGMALVALGRHALLASVLGKVPPKEREGRGWLAFFWGVVQTEVDPRQGLAPLQAAAERFRHDGSSRGELLAHSHLIYYHSFIDCDFKSIAGHLGRAEELYGQLEGALDSHLKVHILYCLSVGFSFLEADTLNNDRFAQEALSLAEEQGLDNFVAMIRSINGIAHLFAGDWKTFLRQMEASFPLLCSPRIGTISRLNLHAFPLNHLGPSGDLENFLAFERTVRRELPPELYLRSAMAPFILLFKTDLLLGEGRVEEALETSELSLQHPHAAHLPHLRSQYLNYRGLILSLLGRKEGALAAAEESLALRQSIGGKIFQLINYYLVGGVFALNDRQREADKCFARALELSRQIGEEYLRPAVLAYRAHLRLEQGRIACLREDLALLLKTMRRHGYDYFFGWMPQMMRPLLERAVSEGLEADYARKLARRRLGLAIDDDGKSFPLLEIRTFGGLCLAVGGRVVLEEHELSRAQRDLLTLLVAAPGNRLPQDRVQAELWRDSSPAKARSNLDSLVLRLRKTLEAVPDAGSGDSRNYLRLQRGILYLSNCRIDALEFLEHAQRGLAHYRREEFWQAGNAFQLAHGRWRGAPAAHAGDSMAVRDFRSRLVRRLVEVTLAWCPLLESTGRLEDALAALHLAWEEDRTNDRLVGHFYRIYVRSNRLREARMLLKEYEQRLRAEEYPEEEVEEILSGVLTQEQKNTY